MKKQILSVVSIVIFLFSCGDIEESINDSFERSEEKRTEIKKERVEIEIKDYYAWVDKLRVRAVPGLESKRQGAKFVDVLDEGEKVTFLGEKSEELFDVTLRGRDMRAPFYKVRTKKGELGWIFAGALSSFPIDVEHYRVAIAFNEEYSEDFSYYYSEANRLLLPTGVDLVFVDSNFEEVNIRNIKGEIIGTENISRYVRKYKSGILCVEKGNKSKFISYSPDMGYDVISHFGVGYCGGDL